MPLDLLPRHYNFGDTKETIEKRNLVLDEIEAAINASDTEDTSIESRIVTLESAASPESVTIAAISVTYNLADVQCLDIYSGEDSNGWELRTNLPYNAEAVPAGSYKGQFATVALAVAGGAAVADWYYDTATTYFYEITNAGSGTEAGDRIYRAGSSHLPLARAAVVIGTTDSTRVLIFDLTNDDCSMWADEEARASGLIRGPVYPTIEDVTWTGQKLILATSGTYKGLYFWEFSLGTAFLYHPDGLYTRDEGLLFGTDVGNWTRTTTSHDIPDATIVAVVSYVAPNAPIDQLTGMPVPYIGLGTVSGSALITPNGEVFSQGSSRDYYQVFFLGDYFFGMDNEAHPDAFNIMGRVGILADNYVSLAAIGVGSLGVSSVTTGSYPAKDSVLLTDPDSISLFIPNPNTIASYMFAKIGTDFNTGWMVDPQSAAICKTQSDAFAIFTGVSSEAIATPYDATHKGFADMEFIAKIYANDIDDGAQRCIIGQWTGNSIFSLFNNELRLVVTDATGAIGVESDSTFTANGIADLEVFWAKATLLGNNGASDSDWNFYYSKDETDDEDAVNWTPIGGTVLGGRVVGVTVGSSALSLGVANATALFDGGIRRALVKNAIGGTIVFDWWADDYGGGSSMVNTSGANTGETMTLGANSAFSGDIVGGNIVPNGDFASGDLTSWNDVSTGSASATYNGGAVDITGTNSFNRGIFRSDVIAVAIGKTYRLTATCTSFTSGNFVVGILPTTSLITPPDRISLSSAITSEIFFEATATTLYIFVYTSAAGVGSFDDFIIEEVVEDYSGNANHLDITGTLSRKAVVSGGIGALTGFDTSTYLDTVSAGLDFDGISFTFPFFFKTALSAKGFIIATGEEATGKRRHVYMAASGEMGFDISGNIIESVGAYNDDKWHSAAITSNAAGDNVRLYMDGELDGIDTGMTFLSFTYYYFRVGLNVTDATPFDGSIALLGPSSSEWNAAAIRKWHNDGMRLLESGTVTLANAIEAAHHDDRNGVTILLDSADNKLELNGLVIQSSSDLSASIGTGAAVSNSGRGTISGGDTGILIEVESKNSREAEPELHKERFTVKYTGDSSRVQFPLQTTDAEVEATAGCKPIRVVDNGSRLTEGSSDDWEVGFDGFNYWAELAVAPGVNDVIVEFEKELYK